MSESTGMSMYEQLQAAQKANHDSSFAAAFADNGGLPVTTADVEFAVNCSRDQLFILACAAHAKARLANREPQ